MMLKYLKVTFILFVCVLVGVLPLKTQSVARIGANVSTGGSLVNPAFPQPVSATPDSAGTNDGAKLLQFTSAGHVLGFSEDGVIVASARHMLKVDFLNSRVVAPEADDNVSGENNTGEARPLGRVTYKNVWDGVTVVYEASGASVAKSTYYIDATKEGVPVDRIRLGYNRPVQIDEKGNLLVTYEDGTMVEGAPVAWQETEGGRHPVTVTYVLHGEREVGFSLGDYIPGIPVVIDPTMTWNTFLGGSGNDYGLAIAVDGSGNVYVGGFSDATWGAPVRTYTSGTDGFAAKLDSSGVLQWNTFLGGSGNDSGRAIAADGSGNVYVAGQSDATWGAPVRTYTSGTDGFAAKLNSSGALQWNTFLGSSGTDYGLAIAVDGSGNVYVGGYGNATWGAPVRAYTSGYDAFAVKLTSSGSLTWNTFLGGSGFDSAYGIAVDGSGNVYIGGNSNATWGAPVRAYTLLTDAFAVKLTSSGNLTWNTFLGGSGFDQCLAVAVDGSGNVYVAGYGGATWGAPVRAYTLGPDAFAAKLDSSGALQWNTFLGGSGSDYGRGIAVDGSGNVFVGGDSTVAWGAPVRAYALGIDAYTAKLDSSGNLTWNTFLGGSGNDNGYGIAVDGSGNVYVAGQSDATWGAPVRAYTGNFDGWAAKLIFNDAPVASALSITGTPNVGQLLTGHYTYSDLESDVEGVTTFRWLRDGAAIPGATSSTYTVVLADVGTTSTFEVTPVAATGTSPGTPVVSAGTLILNSAPVASALNITGTPNVGQILTGHYTYSDVDGDLEGVTTFRWLSDGLPIVGATSSTYTVLLADLGTTITFEVTPLAATGTSPGTAATSAGTVILNSAPVASALSITGTPNVGQLLTGHYTYSDVDGDLEGVTTFRWLRDGGAIPGATAITYTVVLADLGHTITLEVTPLAATGTSPGTAVQSAGLLIVSSGGGGGGGGGWSDTTPPTSFDISAASITKNSAIITWETNENSDSLVRFGLTTALGGTASDGALVVHHVMPILGLTAGTAYHYTVCSRDSAGNQGCSGDFTFTTLPADAPEPTYSAAEALAASPTINVDKALSAPPAGTSLPCVSGTLIKLPSDGNPATQADSTVYYCGADGKRYIFPDEGTYFSWYKDFSGVRIVSAETLTAIPLGGNVTYRPGSRMLKIDYDPKVYAVAKGGVLRWVTSEAVAQALYGLGWNDLVSDISEAFFVDYVVGAPITLAGVTPAPAPPAACSTIATFTEFLSLGSTSLEVRQLQELLQCLGYFPADVAPTGYFGSVTENAVKEFQSANGVAAVGYVGPVTREALNRYTVR